MYNSPMLEELENPDNYRQFFKDHCVICRTALPQMSSDWIHYKFFGNYCISCDRKISRKLNRKRMNQNINQVYQLHEQQMGRMFNLIIGNYPPVTLEEKEEIINDKIKDEYRYENTNEESLDANGTL